MGTGDSWGTREEFLHPRDSHGRFRKSWKMADNVISRISDFLSKFNPVTFGSDGQAGQYAFNLAAKKPGRFAGGEDLHRLRMDMGHANHALRLGQNDPSTTKFVQMMDREKISAPNDMILSRVTTPEAFGLHADTGDQIQELTGKQLADRGYGAARLGTPLAESIPGQPRVLMTIAVPKGTPVIVPGEGRDDRRVFLDKGQNLRITKVKPDGQGGYYVLAVAESGSSTTPQPMRQLAPSGVTPGEREARITEAQKISAKRMTGAPPTETQAPSTPTPTPAPTPETQAPSTPSPTPSIPSPVPTPETPATPNLEADAAARQAEIDKARSVADSAGRLHEMIGNGETRPEVLRRTIQAQVKQSGLPQETATEWSNAADKPGDLSRLLTQSEQAAGLTRIGEPGQSAKFNGKLHQNIGEATQGSVDVVRPGYSFKTSKGEDVQISRAVVEPAVNAPAPKVTTSETPMTPKIEAPVIQVPAEISKASIPALREAAAKAGIRVPASAKTKAQIVNHILTEMVKGEAVRRGIAKPEVPKEPRKAVSARRPPVPKAPAVAPTDISKMTIPQLRAHAKEQGIKIPSSITRKADIVAHIQGGGKPSAPKSGPTATRVTTDETGKVPKVQHIGEQAAPTDVTKMTISQLRAHAKEQGIRIPSSITRKADIVAHIQGQDKLESPSTPKSANTRLADAYSELRPNGGWVGIADLREKMGGTREEQDAALRGLARMERSGAHIIPVANRKALKERDRSAAITIGGEAQHTVSLTPSALAELRKASPPIPSTPKPQAPTTSTSMSARLADAYSELRPDGGWVSIADLRDKMGGTREDQDRVIRDLLKLQGSGARIIPVANAKALKQRDKDAAIIIGGEAQHAVDLTAKAIAELRKREK